MKIFDKTKIIVIVILVLIMGIWFIFKRSHHAIMPAQDSVMVEVRKVKQGNIPIEIQAVGALTAARNVQLTPEVAGMVSKILVSDGTYVKKGTPIIQLDDTVNRAKLDSAKANLVFSESNYKRMLLLGKKGAISQQAIDQALADLKGKKAIADEAHVLVSKMLLTAPFDGVLGKTKVNPGEYVGIAQPLVSLTDTQHLRVEFNVSEKYLSLIKVGQEVTITTSAYAGKEFHGKVAYIAPTINTEDRTIAVYAEIPNEDRKLAAGLFVNVTQALGFENNAILIPAVSLVATIDGQQVFKVVNGKAVAVPVKIGQRTSDQVQILQGLVLDDTVVTSGQHKIKDGMPVKLNT